MYVPIDLLAPTCSAEEIAVVDMTKKIGYSCMGIGTSPTNTTESSGTSGTETQTIPNGTATTTDSTQTTTAPSDNNTTASQMTSTSPETATTTSAIINGTTTPTIVGRDCKELLDAGETTDGVYRVNTSGAQIDVLCDMTTDGGGWTVFQQRLNGQVDFYRNWTEYVEGFGTVAPDEEFWLGLEMINKLSGEGHNELFVKMTAADGVTAWAKYSTFTVRDATNDYTLHINGYNGTAGDSMIERHNERRFSTHDYNAKPIGCGNSCAEKFHGAWWYECCHRANLNGRYYNGTHEAEAVGVNWFTFRGYHDSLMYTAMMTRPVTPCTNRSSTATNSWPISSVPGIDCKDVLDSGYTSDGVYKMKGTGLHGYLLLCDMTTAEGGWTVFQQRIDGKMDFYRPWLEYVNGFGTITVEGEFWLGLENIHKISTSGPSELYVSLLAVDCEHAYARYSEFNVSSSATKYTLHAAGYNGTSGDALGGRHDGRPFSTYDNVTFADGCRNDHCPVMYHGAWWYECCHYANLNGRYLRGAHSTYADGLEWFQFRGNYDSLIQTTMMMRRL